MRKRGKQKQPAQGWLKPKTASGGPVSVANPEEDERRKIRALREIALDPGKARAHG